MADPFDRVLEYANVMGEISGTLSIHEATVKDVSREGNMAAFRMDEAERALKRIREILDEIQKVKH